MGPDAMILVFWMLSIKPTFSLSSFTFIKRLFSSLLSAIRVVLSAYVRLLIFLPAILIQACASSSKVFLMMFSAYKLNKQGDNIQPWCTPFPIWNQSVVPCPVLTVASWPAYRFLRRQVRRSGIPTSFRIFQFIDSLSQFVDSVTWAESKWLAPIQRWNDTSNKMKWLTERHTSSKSWSRRKVQVSCSVAQSCLTFCNPKNGSTPHFPVLHSLQSLLKLMPIESVKPSNHLILCRSLLLLPSIFPGIRVFSKEPALYQPHNPVW